MAKKRYYDADDVYAGMSSRRHMERMDAGMIREDHNQVANLPQEWFMKEYPKPDYARYNLNDTIRVIDNQIDDDLREDKKGKFPEKY